MSAEERLDTVFVGARVIDPESGLDAIANVGWRDGTIVHVGAERPAADVVRDVHGLVLAPGFIDLHSHAQTISGLRLQALDGVTTALDLEGGAAGVAALLDRHGDEGRPINFGYSAGWMVLRADVMDGEAARVEGSQRAPVLTMEASFHDQPGSRRSLPAERIEVDHLLDLIEGEVAAGAIGVGVPIGYLPDAGRIEYFRIAQLAAAHDVPVFTHARFASNVEPGSSVDAALEIIAAAAGTGAAMHHCHLNSTSLRQIDMVTDAIEQARANGNRVTTEAYPYGSGSTTIGAGFLAPNMLHRMGLEPTALRYLPTGERVADAARLTELRAEDPGGLCVIEFLREDDPADLALLLEGVCFPDTAVASDATPLVRPGGSWVYDDWPLPPDVSSHPRSAGCFARVLGWIVRELGAMTLGEAIRRSTLLPAQILERSVPAMARKGRVQVGADADLVVFDPATVGDRATYEQLAPSVGFHHVVVNGTMVVRDGSLRTDVAPGRPVRSEVR